MEREETPKPPGGFGDTGIIVSSMKLQEQQQEDVNYLGERGSVYTENLHFSISTSVRTCPLPHRKAL